MPVDEPESVEDRGDQPLVFEAVYLHELSAEHMREKLAAALALDAAALLTLCVLMPASCSRSAVSSSEAANIEDDTVLGSGNNEPTAGRSRPLNPSVKNIYLKASLKKQNSKDDYNKACIIRLLVNDTCNL